MRKLVSRWSILSLLVAWTLVGVEHRLATLPVAPPEMVSAASFALPQ